MLIDSKPGGGFALVVLYEDELVAPGPFFEGDLNNFDRDTEGVVIVPAGTPFKIDTATAEAILARSAGAIIQLYH